VTIAFGCFVLDTDRHQLLQDGCEIHLSRKAFELLSQLLRARPRVLTKNELHEKLWPDTFVSDATLASLVAEVRDALHEPARASHFIRTVHGFGYAFAGEAVDVTPAAERPSMPQCWIERGDQRRPLPDGEYVLGRDQQATICLESLSVSRRHARLRVANGQATIEDLGSRNGTFVGDRPTVGPVVLGDGDTFRLGSVVLTFRSMVAPRSTAPLEATPPFRTEPEAW
jgi:DNA-binding winged helix-turn-helix (wHTH) protein